MWVCNQIVYTEIVQSTKKSCKSMLPEIVYTEIVQSTKKSYESQSTKKSCKSMLPEIVYTEIVQSTKKSYESQSTKKSCKSVLPEIVYTETVQSTKKCECVLPDPLRNHVSLYYQISCNFCTKIMLSTFRLVDGQASTHHNCLHGWMLRLMI